MFLCFEMAMEGERESLPQTWVAEESSLLLMDVNGR